MALTTAEVEHIAELARLSLSEQEKSLFQDQLSAILDYAGILQGVDTSAVSPTATVIRDVLVLEAVGSRQSTEYRAQLLDISGRRAMDLRPGANDMQALAPGVYFVRAEPSAACRRPSAVTKVILER